MLLDLTFSTGTIHVLLTVGTLPLQTWPARLWRNEDDASVWGSSCYISISIMIFVNQSQGLYVTSFAGDDAGVWKGAGAIVDCSPAQHAVCAEKKGRYLHLPIQVKDSDSFLVVAPPDGVCSYRRRLLASISFSQRGQSAFDLTFDRSETDNYSSIDSLHPSPIGLYLMQVLGFRGGRL
jgi:hypothetical protein